MGITQSRQKIRMKTLLLLCLIITLASCIRITDPQTIQNKEQTIRILADILILNHAINDMAIPTEKKDSIRCQYRNRIFAKHNIDSARFAKSLEAWHEHPILLDTFYSQVLTQLHLDQIRLEIDRAQKVNPQ
jgi:hypothetical protein